MDDTREIILPMIAKKGASQEELYLKFLIALIKTEGCENSLEATNKSRTATALLDEFNARFRNDDSSE